MENFNFDSSSQEIVATVNSVIGQAAEREAFLVATIEQQQLQLAKLLAYYHSTVGTVGDRFVNGSHMRGVVHNIMVNNIMAAGMVDKMKITKESGL